MFRAESNTSNLLIISGGSKGLGKALIEIYNQASWEVCEFSRSGKSQYNQFCDFNKPEEAEKIISRKFESLAESHWDNVLLINNAATIDPIGTLGSGSVSKWSQALNTNIQSIILLSTLLERHLQQSSNHSVLASISSGAGITPYRGWSVYCATKAALEMYTDCIALEQKDTENPIIPIVIYPSVIDTEMQETIRNQNIECMPDVEKFKEMKQNNVLESPVKIARAIKSIMQSPIMPGGRYDVRAYF